MYPVRFHITLKYFANFVIGGDDWDLAEDPMNPLSDGTQAAWDNMTWNDLRWPKPTYATMFGTNDAAWEWHVISTLNTTFDQREGDWDSIPVMQAELSSMTDKTITASGVTGAQTINKRCGSVNFGSGTFSLVVTNNLVTTDSVIVATMATNDTNMNSVKAVPSNGSFTLYVDNQPASETRVNWAIIA